MNEHVHVCAGLERLACFFNQRLETRKMCFICMCAAACGIIVPNVEDTIGWLTQDKLPALFPEDIRPLLPRQIRHMHNGKRFLQEIGKPDIFHVKRRAEQLIFASEASVNKRFVQSRLCRDGLGCCLNHPIPRYDPDGTHHKCLLHALLIQTVTLRCK